MDAKAIGAGVLGISATVMGAVDATTFSEVPLDRVEIIAEERVEAKQIENRVETTFPWKDQNGLKVVYDMGEPTIGERFSDKRKHEVITEVVDFGDGGFKIDVLLNERPDTNRFCYLIEGAEQYDFFYQPELTAEEIEQGAERPEEIVGSYAVYHKELKNHRVGQENYATGKVMHIPRPQVWELNDEENTKEWAELSYEDSELCVTVSEDYLAKATYPVRIDPTFGYTPVGTSQLVGADFAATKFQAPEDGNITSITAVVNVVGGTTSLNYGYFNDDNPSTPSPGTHVAHGAAPITPGTVFAYVSVNVSGPVVGGEYYWLAMQSTDNSSDDVDIRYDDGGSANQTHHWTTFSEYDWSDNPGTLFYRDSMLSIYATYEASGGGDPALAQDVILFD